MVNINQICEKIIQGPQNVYTKVNPDVNSAFLQILSMMSQTQAVETEVKTVDNDVGEIISEVLVTQDENEIEPIPINSEMIQLWLIQTPIQVEIAQTNSNEVVQDRLIYPSQPIIKNVIVETDEQVNVDKPIQMKEVIEFKFIEPANNLTQEKVEVVIEESSKNEIHKHYRVLNQSVKLKETLKLDDSIQVNQNHIKHVEIVAKNDVEISEIDLLQFKQSLQEMKASLENITRKEDETIVFKLKPEGLAEIIIKFEQKLGKVTLDISTSNKGVEQLIQKELPHLRDSLKSYQMEVNLNEMNFKENSRQSHQFKSFQSKQVFTIEQEEFVDEEWIKLPKTYGFNTYV